MEQSIIGEEMNLFIDSVYHYGSVYLGEKIQSWESSCTPPWMLSEKPKYEFQDSIRTYLQSIDDAFKALTKNKEHRALTRDIITRRLESRFENDPSNTLVLDSSLFEVYAHTHKEAYLTAELISMINKAPEVRDVLHALHDRIGMEIEAILIGKKE
ncbi:MAG: hypothetical protein AAF741_11100 [Bacteroidota bacterium]